MMSAPTIAQAIRKAGLLAATTLLTAAVATSQLHAQGAGNPTDSKVTTKTKAEGKKKSTKTDTGNTAKPAADTGPSPGKGLRPDPEAY